VRETAVRRRLVASLPVGVDCPHRAGTFGHLSSRRAGTPASAAGTLLSATLAGIHANRYQGEAS